MNPPEPPQNWPFTSPPNEAVITLRSVIEESKPILHVCRDADDGGWQFMDGSDVREEDARIISLYEMFTIDPSIAELADLPEGWHAWRQTAASEWERERQT